MKSPISSFEGTAIFPPWQVKEILCENGLAKSKSEAQRFLEQKGVYIDGEQVDHETALCLDAEKLKKGVVIRCGKWHHKRFITLSVKKWKKES